MLRFGLVTTRTPSRKTSARGLPAHNGLTYQTNTNLLNNSELSRAHTSNGPGGGFGRPGTPSAGNGFGRGCSRTKERTAMNVGDRRFGHAGGVPSPLHMPSRPQPEESQRGRYRHIQSCSIHRSFGERGVQILRGSPQRRTLSCIKHLNGTVPVRTHAAHAQIHGLWSHAGGGRAPAYEQPRNST